MRARTARRCRQTRSTVTCFAKMPLRAGQAAPSAFPLSSERASRASWFSTRFCVQMFAVQMFARRRRLWLIVVRCPAWAGRASQARLSRYLRHLACHRATFASCRYPHSPATASSRREATLAAHASEHCRRREPRNDCVANRHLCSLATLALWPGNHLPFRPRRARSKRRLCVSQAGANAPKP